MRRPVLDDETDVEQTMEPRGHRLHPGIRRVSALQSPGTGTTKPGCHADSGESTLDNGGLMDWAEMVGDGSVVGLMPVVLGRGADGR